jgi:glycine/D-amino acid oxidase-like deaminating enzyme
VIGGERRVVVVGGGVGGLSTAVELRRLGHTGPVVVLDAAPCCTTGRR